MSEEMKKDYKVKRPDIEWILKKYAHAMRVGFSGESIDLAQYALELEKELSALRPIAEAALSWVEVQGQCHFCCYGLLKKQIHDDDCPLYGLKAGSGEF